MRYLYVVIHHEFTKTDIFFFFWEIKFPKFEEIRVDLLKNHENVVFKNFI